MKAPAISLKHYLAMCAACLIWACVSFSVSNSYSNTEQNQGSDIAYPNIGSDGTQGTCESRHPGKLLAVVVPCIRDVVQEATTKMTDEFDEYLKAPAFAFMTLVITLFGVKMLMNEGDLKKQGVLLLFKIGGVMLFMDNFGGFIPAAFGTIKDASDIVTTSLASVSSSYQCNVGAYQGEKPWNYMDCILGELFGFAPGMIVGSSIFGIMGTALWSGQFGATLFAGGIAALVFVLKMIIHATYVYLMALVIVGFLIVMSPLLIPLVMMGSTQQYFEHWWKALVSVMLQPVIVLAYLALSFSILDKMMFDDELGLAKTLSQQEIKDAQNAKSGSGNFGSNNDPVAFMRRVGGDVSAFKSPKLMNDADPKTVASMMNWKDLSSLDFRSERASKAQKIFFSMAALVIMAWLLDQMLKEIISIAQQVLGGGFALGMATSENPLSKKLDNVVGQAKSGFESGGASGGVNSMTSAIQGLFKGR